MLTAPLLLSAIPESYNSTRLIFSSVYSPSDSGINFQLFRSDYNALNQGLHATFDDFSTFLNSVAGQTLTRTITKDSLSPAHIKWFKDNRFEVLDTDFTLLDVQAFGSYQPTEVKRIFKVLVTSSNGAVLDTGISNGVSSDVTPIPLMYDKTYRTSVTDWVTIPLVSGRKIIYVATSGNDSNNGLTEGTAKLTVSSAYNILNSGDHILFRRGNTWTNQAFGGTSNGLPSNLCADAKSGSSLTCPTYVGAWGPETDPLPIFNITNSAISTFFLADTDDAYSGLSNFYVKCLHVSGGARNKTEENNGDEYPSFFTLLNTGGSGVATEVSGPAVTDNILIEGCTFTEIGNAITMAAYYNSLVAGPNNTYNWGTSNFVSSYTGHPAAIKNVLIRRNIFKDLHYIPADSISRSGGLNQYLNNIFNYRNQAGAYEYRSPSEPTSLAKYHLRFAALIASLNKGQPKAIFIQGASGHGNTVEGNIFYRCGNKLEEYPETYDRSHLAVVHAEGGYAGINVFRNIFYKSGGTAVKQLDGGSNISNIYYRNPESIVMMGDVGLYDKKTHQGVPTQETFAAVSGGFDIRYLEGSFVPYWYWFNKNTGLSIIRNNIIEEPQDIGYNIKNVSGDVVTYDRSLPEQTAESKSNAIVVLGGMVTVKDNYIGNISKGICTAKTAVILGGYGRHLAHWDRGANSVTHSSLSSAHEWQNKVIFQNNVINNHGAVQLELHNWLNGRFLAYEAPSQLHLFDASCLQLIGNTFRNHFWNNRAPINKNAQLSEAGVSLIRMYSDALAYAGSTGLQIPRIVFTGNKLSFNPGVNSQRGFDLIGRVGQPNGEISYSNASSLIPCLFGATLNERRNTVAENPMYSVGALYSEEGESNFSWLETYISRAGNLSFNLNNGGWSKYEPYNYGQAGGTRIFYVDPINGSNSNNGLHPNTPFRNIKSALSLLEPNRPDWILLKRGRTFRFDEIEVNGVVSLGPPLANRRHTNFVPAGTPTDPLANAGADFGIYLRTGGLSKEYPMIFGAYGSDADPTTGNWFGSAAEQRPLLLRSLSGCAPGFPTVGGFFKLGGRSSSNQNAQYNQDNFYNKYTTIMDLHMAGLDYGPNGAEPANAFCRNPNQGGIGCIDWGYNGSVSGLRVEGCLFENWHSDYFGGLSPWGVAVPGVTTGDKNYYNKDITLYRCAMYKNFHYASWSNPGRSSAMYLGYTSGISAIECSIDSAGRRWETPIYVGSVPPPDSANGQPSIYSHSFYWSEDCFDGYVDSCIFARSSSHGVQFRTGGKALRNVFLKVPLPLLLNACNSQAINCDTLRFTRVGSQAISNLMWNSADTAALGFTGSNGGPAGFPIDTGAGSAITIDDNIMMKQGGDYEGSMSIAISLGGDYPQGTFAVSGCDITNNVIYNYMSSPNGGGVAIWIRQLVDSPAIRIQGNKIWSSRPSSFRALHLANGWVGSTVSPVTSIGNNYGNNNTAYCPTVTGCGAALATMSTSSFVTSRWLDNTSIFDNTNDFPDPERGVASYLDEVYGQSTPTNKLDFFMQKARENRKGNWDYRWTAESFNNYVREGFGKPPVSRTITSVESFLTSAINNMSCGNSAINFAFTPQNIIQSNISKLLTVLATLAGGSPATGDVLPAISPSLINSLNGESLLFGQQGGYTLTLRNNTGLRQVFTYTDDSSQTIQATVGPKKTIEIKPQQISEGLIDLISRKALTGTMTMRTATGTIQKNVVNDSLDLPQDAQTISDVRQEVQNIKDFIISLITSYAIPATYEELVYGKPMFEFYSSDAEEAPADTPVTQFLKLAYPIILDRKNTLLVVADFTRYCIGVLDGEIKILSTNTALTKVVTDGSNEESLDQLIYRYQARVSKMREELRDYLDAAIQGRRTVDSVFISLGVESA